MISFEHSYEQRGRTLPPLPLLLLYLALYILYADKLFKELARLLFKLKYMPEMVVYCIVA